LVWFIWSIWSVWFNQTNKTDQINKRNQPILALHAPQSVALAAFFNNQLSSLLPDLINKLTPSGTIEAGGIDQLLKMFQGKMGV
jgi:hypothetical protein